MKWAPSKYARSRWARRRRWARSAAPGSAVKTDGCLVNHVITELQIQCLASQLPEFITVDLGELAKGQTLHVNDLKLGKDIKVVTHGKPNPVVASTSVQAAEEEVTAPVVAVPAAAPTKAKKSEKQNKK